MSIYVENTLSTQGIIYIIGKRPKNKKGHLFGKEQVLVLSYLYLENVFRIFRSK